MEKYDYEYSLMDYRAIEKANINLSGLTVLSGINGCGKSTISRWLYYIVNEDYDLATNLVRDYAKWIFDKFFDLRFASTDLNRTFRPSTDTTLRLMRLEDTINPKDPNALDNIYNLYNNYLNDFSNQLSIYLTQAEKGARRKRILNFLHVEDNNDTEEIVSTFLKREREGALSKKQEILENTEKRPVKAFFHHIKSNYGEADIPSKIQLKENHVSLIGKDSVNTLFNLNRAIYVDSPMAVSERLSQDNYFWSDLRKLMIQPKLHNDIGKEEKKLLIRIRGILHGYAIIKEDKISDSSELYFSDNIGNKFPLDEAATGYKTFSYIQRLLENGYLNDKTLLLIDEPEAHLHPQWIVEFARILVLIHKNVGTKIMIASHNPDMVAAIQSIARKEGELDDTNFYIATPSETNRGKFVYKDLGPNIEDIFSSFNIALDRIKQYGME